MLLDLPVEVILEISRYLSFKSKLNLAITCRKLNDLISSATLYEYVNTVDRRRAAETIITRFKDKEINGSQVKTLNVFMLGLPGELMLELPEIFPNLRRVISDYKEDTEGEQLNLHYRHYRDEYFNKYKSNKKRFMENPECNWIKSLQIYDSAKDWYAIWIMLKQYTFPQLVELKISENGNFRDQIRRRGFGENNEFDEFYLVPYFKNAPSLKKLTLHRLTMSLKLLDEIHAICPLIETLELDDIEFNVDNDSLSQPILPANSVFHLELRNVIDFDKEHLYLDYIPQKYPKLKHLYFDRRRNPNENPFSMFTFNIIAEAEIEKEAKEESIKRNKTTFISRLPKTITTLKTRFTDEESLRAIAESGMKIVTLDMSHKGHQAQNIQDIRPLRYIRTLRSLKVDMEACGKVFFTPLTWNSITKLNIRYVDSPLYIDWFLSLFPSLEDLTLTAKEGIVEKGNCMPLTEKTYPNLKKIRIQESKVYPTFFTFTKQAVPHLEIFNVSCYIGNECLYADMTGWKLKQFALYVYDSLSRQERIHGKITIQGISREFIFLSPENAVLLLQGDDCITGITSSMDISCDDIGDFKINTIPIKRIGENLYCG